MRHYFLGMAEEYSDGAWFRHLVSIGRKRDLDRLRQYLTKRYHGETMLCKNGRSALALALKANFEPGDAIVINGFTCYAVYEAVKKAGLTPVFVDISKEDLNFDIKKLNAVLENSKLEPDGKNSPEPSANPIRGIVVQNTLGNPVDIEAIEALAKKYDLKIVEDLAHCAGVRYSDGREAGTVGVATVLSFGKEKSIDTVSGGAVILRSESMPNFGASSADSLAQKTDVATHDDAAQPLPTHTKDLPQKPPKLSDHLRAKFYPMFGALTRTLTYVGIGGVLMRCLVKIHWVERSADNKLDLKRRCSKFEAKLALSQLQRLRKNGEEPIREFCYVRDREELLKKLQRKGYYFGGFWYEKPVSPSRYYKKVHFDEKNCPNACFVAEHIINIPVYYTKRDLKPARELIDKYLENVV